MSISRDDVGNINNLYSLRPISRAPANHRDASGPGGTWRQNPTLIQTPGRGQNPYGKSRLRSNDGKVATSSSSQPASKRQKLDGNDVSKYFTKQSSEPRTRSRRAQVVLSPSPSRRGRAADAIVIDEEDDTSDSSSKPITLKTSSPDPDPSKTSSPDPMDIIPHPPAYTFDPSKPSPMHQFSSSWEEMRRSPTDGESTARLRNLKQTEAQYSPSRPYGNLQSAKASITPGVAPSGRADRSSGGNNVTKLRSRFEPPVDLQARTKQNRKDAMKPKQVNNPLSVTWKDQHATRPSGFVGGSGPSQGKAIRRDVMCHLPLEEWSIGMDIPPHEATPEPRANLIWEQGLLKVQHMNSIIFELRLEKGSLEEVQYVDIKKTTSPNPLIQILPLRTATIQSSTGFRLGSTQGDGVLTFKFDSGANDWNAKLYSELVQSLVGALVSKGAKSILDQPGATAVWETVTRAHENQPTLGRLESLPLDSRPKKSPDSMTKPRPRPKSRTEVAPTTDSFVRRSARLSGTEQQRFSPRPDPDEVILAYRSGTGSLNITNGDVSRLKPGEFLNDTLIEFGLKLWLADLHDSNPELASQIHVFSSFFYKKLSTKIPEEGYNSVRKWTSKFDLFQKKYIIVPINENMHWYLAIIYFPEYTLLPRPTQVTNAVPRRSTRRLGVVIDCSDVKDSEHTAKRSLPPDPDPPPSAQADSASRSGLLTPDSSRTEDQREEIDVERMVESGGPLTDPSAMQIDGPCVEAVNKDVPVDDAVDQDDSLTLLYPASPPHAQCTELQSLDHQGDVIEQEGHPASRTVSEGGDVRTSGIPPQTFYGKSNHRRRSVPSPEISLVENGPSVEIVDAVMANPDSDHEEAAEHLKTCIFTFDSLSSKHPQAVKRLSKYLLLEAHDKKQLEEDKLTEPKGMQANVPRQTNYCDCGIYLLHFAKTFMKDPKLSSQIIQNRSSPQKARRVPHEHWDKASVGGYREELTARIYSLSEEWKRQRGGQDPAATRNQTETAAVAPPQEQSSADPTPAASSKADADSDSEIEVLGSPIKAPKATSRRDSVLADSRKTTRIHS